MVHSRTRKMKSLLLTEGRRTHEAPGPETYIETDLTRRKEGRGSVLFEEEEKVSILKCK